MATDGLTARVRPRTVNAPGRPLHTALRRTRRQSTLIAIASEDASMRKLPARTSLAVIATIALAACNVTAPSAPTAPAATREDPAPSGSWLQGSVNERLETIADQLGGFDVTMREIDHRYGALYFAGQDRNWGYAAYQIEEMGAALALGLQRRPARAPNAAMLGPALDAVAEAVESRDAAAFEAAFAELTATCNACHRAEDMAFLHVAPPEYRRSSIRQAPQAPRQDHDRD